MSDDNKVSDNHHEAQAVAEAESPEAIETPMVEEKPEKGESRSRRALHKENQRLKEQEAKLQAELETQRDQFLRRIAEMENFRKRSERDFNLRLQMSLADFYLELLPILDDLERSQATVRTDAGEDKNQELESLANGLSLILQNLRRLLESRGVKMMQTVGMPFDPTRHEALGEVDGNGQAPQTVLEEHVKGYMLHDRVLRPAKVMISK
jgi:molecular chaperone GrpE